MRTRSIVALLLATISLLLTSCGGGGGSSSGGVVSSASTQQAQRFVGYFSEVGADSPFVGLQVKLMQNGSIRTTDDNGRAQLDSAAAISGSVELEVMLPSGSSFAVLEGVPADASVISYEASVDQASGLVQITSLRYLRAGELDQDLITNWVTPERCLLCHGDFGAPFCENRIWEGIHRGIYDCIFEVPEPIVPVEEETFEDSSDNSSDDDNSSSSSSSNKNEKDRNKKRPGSKTPAQCLECHGDRGGPRCGNARWENLHPWYNCGSNNKKDKKKGKNKRSFESSELENLSALLAYQAPSS